ncbi:hypothetical protein HK22_10045 [Gluconobacter sp. DsW_056]|uniref:hypothetical protein n=1 Tax=Gluconobacter sp. DsW_056 TaxID=1511209 RepID=UPI000B6C385F|nr:hypothetical protein [Gluconobacter sp. DsW_056]OUI83233.1 hypothetical protein HK22_10045 [Gluconobacter sp. DsW_056]
MPQPLSLPPTRATQAPGADQGMGQREMVDPDGTGARDGMAIIAVAAEATMTASGAGGIVMTALVAAVGLSTTGAAIAACMPHPLATTGRDIITSFC